MWKRFVTYGLAGWVTEVLFTGLSSAIGRDRSATAKTYLWMHPIYGAAGLGLEWLSHRVGHLPRFARPLPYLGLIYAAEYTSGWALKAVLGKCPWDYTGRGINLHGFVRLDYAPAWYLLGLAFEPVRDALHHTEHLWAHRHLLPSLTTHAPSQPREEPAPHTSAPPPPRLPQSDWSSYAGA